MTPEQVTASYADPTTNQAPGSASPHAGTADS